MPLQQTIVSAHLLGFKGGRDIGGIPGRVNGACNGGKGPGNVAIFGNVDCIGRPEIEQDN